MEGWWWQGRRGKKTGRVYKTYHGPAGEYAESLPEAKKGGRTKRKRILGPPERAKAGPPAAAPENPIAEAQAPNCDFEYMDDLIIWSLFKDMPNDKKKDV